MMIKSETQLRALLNLLDDSNEEIYKSVKTELLNSGTEILELINEFSQIAENRDRYFEIESEIRFREIFKYLNEITDFSKTESLEDFCFNLSKIAYPEIEILKYKNEINDIAIKLKERLTSINEPSDILIILINFIFKELGFKGNIENYYELDNNFLHKAIDRKKANPITLSILLICIANRINIPIKGIGLPGHFIVSLSYENYLAYIDPFNKGTILNSEQCREIIEKYNYQFDEKFLLPISNENIIVRIFRNLINYFEKEEDRFSRQMCLRCIDIIKKNE